MSSAAPHRLSENTISIITDLAQANLDSVKGFEEVAAAISGETLELFFRRVASERKRLAAELKAYIAASGERVPEEGSWLAAFHRCWIDLRSMLTCQDTEALLAEVERGEEYLRAAYEDALSSTKGVPINDVLQLHYAKIKSVEDALGEFSFRHAHV